MTNFIDLIGMVGSLTVGALGILIVLSYLRARRMRLRAPEIRVRIPIVFAFLLVAVFIVGAVVEFMNR